jgi:hypothetical protein
MPGFPGLQGGKEGIQAILDQLEGYLETSEQEEAFTNLADTLRRDIIGKNSKHPGDHIQIDPSQATEREVNAGQISSKAVEKSESDRADGSAAVYDPHNSSDPG